MVSWEDAKAVFVEVDECESGWMALADVGGALQRAGVTCTPGEVETWLVQLESTQEEAGVLSVDEFYRLCCAFSTGANGATVEIAEKQTADAGGDAVRPTAREAELLAALDAARSENAGLRRRLEMSGEAAPAPAARAGASGGIYDPRWTERVRPLYDEHMGVENMGPLLYSLIRFVKPRRILEVGAGYTTLFILQALKDNDAELQHLRAENMVNAAVAASEASVSSNDNSSAGQEAGVYVQEALSGTGGSFLHCVDNQEHDVFTAHGGLDAVVSAADDLELGHLLQVHTADAFELLLGSPAEQAVAREERPPSGTVASAVATQPHVPTSLAMPSEWDMVWLDGITTDPRWPKYFEAIWQQLVDPGGLALVHSTLTNAINRQWLRELTMPPQLGGDGTDDDGEGGDAGTVGTATFSFRPAAPCADSHALELAAAIRAIQLPEVLATSAGVCGDAHDSDSGSDRSNSDGFEPELLRMEWCDNSPTIKPIGFGLSSIELQVVLTVSASAKTVDVAASVVAERMARLLQDQGIQGVEAVAVVPGAANAGGGLQKLEGLVHFGLLEPHVRPHSTTRPPTATSVAADCNLTQSSVGGCVNGSVILMVQKRFQNSVSIFQKRRGDCSPWEPLYSWTP